MKTEDFGVLAWGAYSVSVVVIVFPLIDSLVGAWPLHLDSVTWRFGTLGLLSRAVMTPMLGILLGLATATLFDHRGVLLGFVGLAGLAALVSTGFLGLFLFDALDARVQVTPDAMTAFYLATAAAATKFGLGMLLFSLLALGGIKARTSLRRAASSNRRSQEEGRLVASARR
jgi:hypothetical protein